MKRKLVKSVSIVAVFILVLLQSSAICFAKPGNVVDKSCHGVVRIMAVFDDYFSLGTGFGVGKEGEATDIFVTNHHVIADLEEGDKKPNEIYLILDDADVSVTTDLIFGSSLKYDPNELVACEVLKTSDSSGYPDVAIIKAERKVKERGALVVSKAENSSRSDKVYALGYPGDADSYNTQITSDYSQDQQISGAESDITVTDGTISAFRVFRNAADTKVIQSTTDINHGNSGGPLINEDGAVIGINTYGVGESSYSTAIYIDYAMTYLNDLGIKYDKVKGEADDQGDEDSQGQGSEEGDASDDVEEEVDAAFGLLEIGIILLIIAAIVVIILIIRSRKKAKANSKGQSGQQPGPAGHGGQQPGPGPQHGQGNLAQRAQAPMPSMKVTGLRGAYGGHDLKVKGRMVFGTNVEVCNIVYEKGTPGISRVHCVINYERGQFTVTDAGSSYGTFVNGKKLVSNEKTLLKNGDIIYLASSDQSFRVTIS